MREWQPVSGRLAPQTEPLDHTAGRDAPGPVGADRAGGRPVADELDAGVGDRDGAVELDASARAAQLQRREVVDGRPEAGRPQDHVDGLEGAVGPAHAVGLDAREHRPALVRAEPLGLTLLRPEHQPGDADDAARRQSLAYALLDLGHDLAADLGVELAGAPDRLTPGRPRPCR